MRQGTEGRGGAGAAAGAGERARAAAREGSGAGSRASDVRGRGSRFFCFASAAAARALRRSLFSAALARWRSLRTAARVRTSEGLGRGVATRDTTGRDADGSGGGASSWAPASHPESTSSSSSQPASMSSLSGFDPGNANRTGTRAHRRAVGQKADARRRPRRAPSARSRSSKLVGRAGTRGERRLRSAKSTLIFGPSSFRACDHLPPRQRRRSRCSHRRVPLVDPRRAPTGR